MTKQIIDPLGDVTLLWLYEHSLEQCNCPARDHGGVAKHWWTCSSTPIFARMGPGLVSNALNVIIAANFAMTQTVIKCAICGEDRIGKDMDVVYQCPGPVQTKSVKTMMKAVCPHHNREGTVRWAHART